MDRNAEIAQHSSFANQSALPLSSPSTSPASKKLSPQKGSNQQVAATTSVKHHLARIHSDNSAHEIPCDIARALIII
eukprot:m.11531 g.11531  ORF g.11531 m.11531 type:complete len:77 (+) comp7738_c0_seq1:299-529(+)